MSISRVDKQLKTHLKSWKFQKNLKTARDYSLVLSILIKITKIDNEFFLQCTTLHEI